MEGSKESEYLAPTVLDQQDFRRLFDEYYNMLCNFLHKQSHDWDLSQEIAQRTFVKLWEKRNDISVNSSVKSYLFQSARNTLIDHYRSTKSANHHAEKYAEGSSDLVEIAAEADGLAVTEKIAWAVEQLKPKTKEIFLLSKREGLTYDEIASYLEISKRTVEYNMRNALLQLKELLKGKI